MELLEKYWTDEDGYRSMLKIQLGEIVLKFLDWEPEDANLSRDFNDCNKIVKIVLLANSLWLAWEKLEWKQIEDNDPMNW